MRAERMATQAGGPPLLASGQTLARVRSLQRLNTLAHWLDARFRIPGTKWRFGLDALIGLVPGLGDAAATLASLYLLVEARRLGARKRTLLRMLANIGVDFGLGSVPLLGDIIDFGWKANMRNLSLLERDLRKSG